MPQPKRRQGGSSSAPANRQNSSPRPATLHYSYSEQYASILPKADEIERLEYIVPGVAERIINQFESQGEHRRTLERMDMAADIELARSGLATARLIAILALIGGFVLVAMGYGGAGVLFGGGGVAAIIGTFVYGTNRRRSERIEKSRIMRGQDPG